MESWRKFFEAAGVDFWTVCERALALAYEDNPEEFPTKRDHLARKLFAPEKLDFRVCDSDAPQLIGDCRAAVSQDLGKDAVGRANEENQTPSGAYDELEALTEELEEELLSKRDVISIKETLLDSYLSETEIFNSLRRLELMHLSFDVLKDTEIGKAVNGLRKHSSKKVATLAKQLVRGWKELVHACYRSAGDVTAAVTPDPTASGSLVVDQEEPGLPSPPMDEAGLLVAATPSMEMFQLWDLVDEVTSAEDHSGNSTALDSDLRTSRAPFSRKNADSHPKSAVEVLLTKERRDSSMGLSTTVGIYGSAGKDELRKEHNGIQRRLGKDCSERKAINHNFERGNEARTQQRVQPSVNPSSPDEKILAAKRNLRENYEREENAKKQRTVQVLDLHDLPKGGPGRAKNSHWLQSRPGSQFRPRAMSCK